QDGWVGNRPTADKRRKARTTPHVNRTAATTNNYAVTVGSIFRSAIREGLLLANPCAALEKLPEIDSIQREVFTVAEISRLIESAGNTDWHTKVFPNETDQKLISARCHEWQGMILFGFYAATRIGDASNLKWSNIDLEHKTVKFMPAKTDRKKKVLTLPLHPRMVAYLESSAVDATPEMSLFPSLVLRGSSGDKGLSSQFVAIMETGGIDRRELRKGMKKGVRAQYARSYHALRHSLTSALANADVPEDIRRQITGHDSPETHRIYTHTLNETLARAVEKMPSV
ncbi:site-specific integrase, partial [bacterium]|nr:site-specific integrase [bacterium]